MFTPDLTPAKKIVVTGATGFIGAHLIKHLLKAGYEPIAAGRDPVKLKYISQTYDIETVCFDICSDHKKSCLNDLRCDTLIHLAWGRLNDYNSLIHIEKEFSAHYFFLKQMILGGLKRIVVAGTCFEYGKQDGRLDEEAPTFPVTAYAVAKDTLRKHLEFLSKIHPFSFVWLRYFYLFGQGQGPRTLMSQLDSAIAREDEFFPMSKGEQLRDFMAVEDAALITGQLAVNSKAEGIFNVCSGSPVSVRSLVEQRIDQCKSAIKLDLGYYPYPEYEPMAFWGNNEKIKQVTGYK